MEQHEAWQGDAARKDVYRDSGPGSLIPALSLYPLHFAPDSQFPAWDGRGKYRASRGLEFRKMGWAAWSGGTGTVESGKIWRFPIFCGAFRWRLRPCYIEG